MVMVARRHHLAARRRAVGLSQEHLANRVGLADNVARWELGQASPLVHFTTAELRAFILEVEAGELDDPDLSPAGP